ncbi:MAG: hypothetical protein L6282_01875 [Candidatus Methanoperedenaceae archaeon]|nr:hypothetical protein [Candidatus Methanoperedenaceae archaeon]
MNKSPGINNKYKNHMRKIKRLRDKIKGILREYEEIETKFLNIECLVLDMEKRRI